MLLKWLFTILAIIWLYQALRPLLLGYFAQRQVPPSRGAAPRNPPPRQPEVIRRKPDEDNDYIDYEEVK